MIELCAQIGFEGAFGHQHLSPRGLISSFLRTLVSIASTITDIVADIRQAVVSISSMRSAHADVATLATFLCISNL
jgi:hypothetical protein